MKKTAITIAMMTLILIAATSAQPSRRVVGSTALGGGSGVGVKNRQPRQIGNPFGLGGTVTAGVKNRRTANLGDTATHEVGHKGKRRRGAIGEGASDVNAVAKERTETVDNNEYRTKRPAGFVPPSSDPHGKNPTARRKTHNLLPYIEQDNVYKTRNRQR